MTGRDSLRAARRQAAGAEEGDWRSAASRAYYAAFHAARELLADLRFVTPRAERAHEYLYRRLNNCALAPVVTAAKSLHDLRQTRNWADYDLHLPFPAKFGADAGADAEDIIRTLDALTPGDRVQITGAMKLYEQQIGDVTWRP